MQFTRIENAGGYTFDEFATYHAVALRGNVIRIHTMRSGAVNLWQQVGATITYLDSAPSMREGVTLARRYLRVGDFSFTEVR